MRRMIDRRAADQGRAGASRANTRQMVTKSLLPDSWRHPDASTELRIWLGVLLIGSCCRDQALTIGGVRLL